MKPSKSMEFGWLNSSTMGWIKKEINWSDMAVAVWIGAMAVILGIMMI